MRANMSPRFDPRTDSQTRRWPARLSRSSLPARDQRQHDELVHLLPRSRSRVPAKSCVRTSATRSAPSARTAMPSKTSPGPTSTATRCVRSTTASRSRSVFVLPSPPPSATPPRTTSSRHHAVQDERRSNAQQDPRHCGQGDRHLGHGQQHGREVLRPRYPPLQTGPLNNLPELHAKAKLPSPYGSFVFQRWTQVCIGNKFAMTEMKIILIRVLAKYRIEPVEGLKYKSVEAVVQRPR